MLTHLYFLIESHRNCQCQNNTSDVELQINTRRTMKHLMHITAALLCLCTKTVNGDCGGGNSNQSDSYFTTGGTALEHTPCCFPFIYKGVTLHECTTEDRDRPWCSIDSFYSLHWGECVVDHETTGGACIGSSKPSDKYFTTGGTVNNGTPCCFPFWFKGIWYTECTSVENPVPWCAVDNVYAEENKRWGKCDFRITTQETTGGACIGMSKPSDRYFTTGGTVNNGTPCCFPFLFKGMWYTECTSVENRSPWCAVDNYYVEDNKRWGNCYFSFTTQGGLFRPGPTSPSWRRTTPPAHSPSSLTTPPPSDPTSTVIGVCVPVVILILIFLVLVIFYCRRKGLPVTNTSSDAEPDTECETRGVNCYEQDTEYETVPGDYSFSSERNDTTPVTNVMCVKNAFNQETYLHPKTSKDDTHL